MGKGKWGDGEDNRRGKWWEDGDSKGERENNEVKEKEEVVKEMDNIVEGKSGRGDEGRHKDNIQEQEEIRDIKNNDCQNSTPEEEKED